MLGGLRSGSNEQIQNWLRKQMCRILLRICREKVLTIKGFPEMLSKEAIAGLKRTAGRPPAHQTEPRWALPPSRTAARAANAMAHNLAVLRLDDEDEYILC